MPLTVTGVLMSLLTPKRKSGAGAVAMMSLSSRGKTLSFHVVSQGLLKKKGMCCTEMFCYKLYTVYRPVLWILAILWKVTGVSIVESPYLPIDLGNPIKVTFHSRKTVIAELSTTLTDKVSDTLRNILGWQIISREYSGFWGFALSFNSRQSAYSSLKDLVLNGQWSALNKRRWKQLTSGKIHFSVLTNSGTIATGQVIPHMSCNSTSTS